LHLNESEPHLQVSLVPT